MSVTQKQCCQTTKNCLKQHKFMAIHVVRQRNRKELSTNMKFASEFLNTGSFCLKICEIAQS